MHQNDESNVGAIRCEKCDTPLPEPEDARGPLCDKCYGRIDHPTKDALLIDVQWDALRSIVKEMKEGFVKESKKMDMGLVIIGIAVAVSVALGFVEILARWAEDTGESNACPLCKWEGSEYRKSVRMTACSRSGDRCDLNYRFEQPHLHCTCSQCGYEWVKSPNINEPLTGKQRPLKEIIEDIHKLQREIELHYGGNHGEEQS